MFGQIEFTTRKKMYCGSLLLEAGNYHFPRPQYTNICCQIHQHLLVVQSTRTDGATIALTMLAILLPPQDPNSKTWVAGPKTIVGGSGDKFG